MEKVLDLSIDVKESPKAECSAGYNFPMIDRLISDRSINMRIYPSSDAGTMKQEYVLDLPRVGKVVNFDTIAINMAITITLSGIVTDGGGEWDEEKAFEVGISEVPPFKDLTLELNGVVITRIENPNILLTKLLHERNYKFIKHVMPAYGFHLKTISAGAKERCEPPTATLDTGGEGGGGGQENPELWARQIPTKPGYDVKEGPPFAHEFALHIPLKYLFDVIDRMRGSIVPVDRIKVGFNLVDPTITTYCTRRKRFFLARDPEDDIKYPSGDELVEDNAESFVMTYEDSTKHYMSYDLLTISSEAEAALRGTYYSGKKPIIIPFVNHYANARRINTTEKSWTFNTTVDNPLYATVAFTHMDYTEALKTGEVTIDEKDNIDDMTIAYTRAMLYNQFAYNPFKVKNLGLIVNGEDEDTSGLYYDFTGADVRKIFFMDQEMPLCGLPPTVMANVYPHVFIKLSRALKHEDGMLFTIDTSERKSIQLSLTIEDGLSPLDINSVVIVVAYQCVMQMTAASTSIIGYSLS